jgi:hypothetical protein
MVETDGKVRMVVTKKPTSRQPTKEPPKGWFGGQAGRDKAKKTREATKAAKVTRGNDTHKVVRHEATKHASKLPHIRKVTTRAVKEDKVQKHTGEEHLRMMDEAEERAIKLFEKKKSGKWLTAKEDAEFNDILADLPYLINRFYPKKDGDYHQEYDRRRKVKKKKIVHYKRKQKKKAHKKRAVIGKKRKYKFMPVKRVKKNKKRFTWI